MEIDQYLCRNDFKINLTSLGLDDILKGIYDLVGQVKAAIFSQHLEEIDDLLRVLLFTEQFRDIFLLHDPIDHGILYKSLQLR